jgi:hypothetical protein
VQSTLEKPQQFPAPATFFLEIPLYVGFRIEEPLPILSVEFFQGTIDAYCIECAKGSVFQSTVPMPYAWDYGDNWVTPATVEHLASLPKITVPKASSMESPGPIEVVGISDYALRDRFFDVTFACTRDPSHLLRYTFRVKGSTAIKIGQHPSLADFHLEEIKQYKGILSDEKYRELSRAIGLSAHGVGIGAFVYLRRIFEDLLEEAHARALLGEGWDEEKYQKARIEERILLLSHYLPQFLVENRNLYGILSKGLHELSEEECLRYFASVKLGIELVLDEKLHEEQRKDKIKQAKVEIV